MTSFRKLDPQALRADLWRLHPARMAETITQGEFVRYKHIEKISRLVADGIFEGGARILLSSPPRHGKSFLMSRWVPAWFLAHRPHKHVILASYESAFAAHWGRQVRNILQENPSLGVEISQDSHAADRWNTIQGGGMFTAGVGGPLTGRGGDLLIVDDYVKNAEEADSPTYQQRAINWWNTTFRTRAEPGASIIVLATRWHENDLIGYLTSDANENKDEWTVINMPAIADGSEDFVDRSLGEPLCPERFDLNSLEDIKRAVGPRSWSALYQGAPTPAEGGLFNIEMFEFSDIPNEFDYRFITADTAYNDKKENDFTVFSAWGVTKDQLYLIDVFRKQIKASEVETPAAQFIYRFSGYNFRGVYIEPKGHGIYLNQMLPRKGILVPSESQIKEFFSDRKYDKVARANNAVPHLAYRKIKINKNIHDKETLLAEVLTFPRAKWDDFTDTLIDAVKYTYSNKLSLADVLYRG